MPHLRRCVELAAEAVEAGDFPFGSVLVDASATVLAGGSPATTSFEIDQAGSITVTFQDAFPPGLGPAPVTPSAPAVVVANTNMNLPAYRLCTPQDTGGCPKVGAGDTTFPASDWTLTGSTTATPLFPFSSPYAVYAGMCSADDPGAAHASVTVTGAGSASAVLTLPAIVVRLHATNGQSALTEPAPNGQLVITDTGCGIRYMSNPGPSLAASQAELLLNRATPPSATTGLLEYPGMPSGSYPVCYTAGGQAVSTQVTNKGSGVSVDLSQSSMRSGSC